MFADRRQWGIGAAVVVVLALGWWSLRQPSPAVPTVAAAGAARPRAPRPAAPATTEEPLRPIRLDRLASSAGSQAPSVTARNPFRFRVRGAAATPTSTGVGRAELPPPAAQTTPAGPAPSASIALKFIGVVERANGVKWAVLSDGRVTLHGRDGDIIDGRYKILKIGTESIELAYIDGHGRQTIRLTGQ